MQSHESTEIDRIEELCGELVKSLRVFKEADEAYAEEEEQFDNWLEERRGTWYRFKEGIEKAYPRWTRHKAMEIVKAQARSKAAKAFNDIGRAVDPDEFVGELMEEFELPGDDDHG